jgi:hypothetical protein
MSSYKRKEIRKIAKEAQLNLGEADRFKAERQALATWLQPVSPGDDHVTAELKRATARYMEEAKRELDPQSDKDIREVFDPDSPVMKRNYSLFIDALRNRNETEVSAT